MRTAAAVLLSLLLAIPVLGAVRDEPQPAPSFVAVPDWPTPSAQLGVVLRDERGGGRDAPMGSVQDVPMHPWLHVQPRPDVVVPSPRLIIATTGDGPQSHRVAGVASWYCGHGSRCTSGYGGGLYAAAGPALRVGDWRGRVVVVAAGGRSVRVTLIDCNCGPNANLIDLYSDAFRRLAPLSQGVVSVTVSW